MNQQPDKFFREKLAGYQPSAPESAWKKIAAAQQKKSRHTGWMKIAASLLLISMAAYLLWPRKGTVRFDQNTLAELNKSASPTISSPRELQPPKAILKDDQPRQNHAASVEKLKPAMKGESQATKNATPQPDPIQNGAEESIPITTSPAASVKTSADETSSETILLEPTYTIAQATPVTAPKNITLTYTAADVNKYLDKKSMTQATPEEKKPSTLMKLLKKANDLKNNQDPMGELRQKKNELLALNFKNEKQRGQNK